MRAIDYQSELSAIIKRKAVGPHGSRHLNEDDLQIIIPAVASDEISLTNKAVLVSSVIILDRNELENRLLKQWKFGKQVLPNKLMKLFFEKADSGFPFILHKILRNEDLNANEASTGMDYLLNPDIPNYQKGVFLIGERLKRENMEENHAFLQTLKNRSNSYSVDVPLLIDLSDPYDGFQRYPIYTPFAASLLGSIGFPAYCHGVQKVAPKNGDTIHKILELAGKGPLKSAGEAAKDIENEDIGWGYIDQSIYFPELNNLTGLREKIVKRPFLATLEKLLQPLRSPKSNFLVTGFVHTDYKEKMAKLLKEQKSVNAALIVKGMEGSTQIDFRKEPESVTVRNGGIFMNEATTDQINYPGEEWEQCYSLAEYTLKTGISALKGKKNTARKILINQVVQILSGLQISGEKEARAKAKKVLNSGQVLRHWQNGLKQGGLPTRHEER